MEQPILSRRLALLAGNGAQFAILLQPILSTFPEIDVGQLYHARFLIVPFIGVMAGYLTLCYRALAPGLEALSILAFIAMPLVLILSSYGLLGIMGPMPAPPTL